MLNHTKNLIEPKLYRNPTENLIEHKLYMNPTKNLIEPKFYKFRFYQVFIWVSSIRFLVGFM
jgi:hypothetical protein